MNEENKTDEKKITEEDKDQAFHDSASAFVEELKALSNKYGFLTCTVVAEQGGARAVTIRHDGGASEVTRQDVTCMLAELEIEKAEIVRLLRGDKSCSHSPLASMLASMGV